MPLIERQSFTNQAINAGKTITFAAAPENYEQVNLRVFLYDLAAVSSAKSVVTLITRSGSGVQSRLILTPSITTASTSVVLSTDLFTLGAGDVFAITVTGGATDTANVDIVAELWGIPDLSAAITAATSPLATAAALAIVDDLLDTEIAAIKAKTDQLVFTVPNQVDANALTGGGSGGTGAIAWTPSRATDPSGNPLDGVDTWVNTDIADPSIGVQARAYTNALGLIATPFLLDAGIYYVWRQHGSYSFSNPETVTVA